MACALNVPQAARYVGTIQTVKCVMKVIIFPILLACNVWLIVSPVSTLHFVSNASSALHSTLLPHLAFLSTNARPSLIQFVLNAIATHIWTMLQNV